MLASDISRTRRRCANTGNRCGVDNRSAVFILQHIFNFFADAVEHRIQISVDNTEPIVIRQIFDLLGIPDDSRVVDRNVQTAVTFDRFCIEIQNVFFFRDIALNEDRFAARLANFLFNGFSARLTAACDDNLGAFRACS